MKQINYNVAITAFLLFIVIAFTVIYNGSASMDSAVYNVLSNIQNPIAGGFFGSITHLFDTSVFIILSFVLLITLLTRKRREDFWFSLYTLGGGAIIGQILKILFSRDRPVGYIIEETGNSFPSGHAIKATLFVLLLIYLFKDQVKNIKWRRFFIVICWVIIVLISFSRLYLGVHWIGDVLGGFLLGLGWFSLMLILFGKEK